MKQVVDDEIWSRGALIIISIFDKPHHNNQVRYLKMEKNFLPLRWHWR